MPRPRKRLDAPPFVKPALYSTGSTQAAMDSYQLVLRQRGDSPFAERLLRSLPDIQEPHADSMTGLVAATLELMRRGVPWIRGAVLMGGGLVATPDLLKRVEHASLLGDFSYVPVAIRAANGIAPGDILDLVSYGLLLQEIQGLPTKIGEVWLETGDKEEVTLPVRVRDEAEHPEPRV